MPRDAPRHGPFAPGRQTTKAAARLEPILPRRNPVRFTAWILAPLRNTSFFCGRHWCRSRANPDLGQVAVRAQHQAIHHLDHVQARAQRGIHRAHFETDDAAAREACGRRAVEHAVIVRWTSDRAKLLGRKDHVQACMLIKRHPMRFLAALRAPAGAYPAISNAASHSSLSWRHARSWPFPPPRHRAP